MPYIFHVIDQKTIAMFEMLSAQPYFLQELVLPVLRLFITSTKNYYIAEMLFLTIDKNSRKSTQQRPNFEGQ